MKKFLFSCLVVFVTACFANNVFAATVEPAMLDIASVEEIQSTEEVEAKAERVVIILDDGTVIIIDGDTTIIIP